MVGGIAPAVLEHCFFNIGGKNGLNGIFGMQLVSASRNALQQAGPMLPNWPVNMDWEISTTHPGIFITDDQHFVISDNSGISDIGWNVNGKRNCGNWAFTETTTHMTATRKTTFLIDMMRCCTRKRRDPSNIYSLYRVCFWLMNNSRIAIVIFIWEEM